MSTPSVLEREEYIEQAYFFQTVRERAEEEVSTQEVLQHVHEEILSTTRLPMAIQFLCTELKHSGLLSSGFERLKHYFTPFQAFVMRGTETEGQRFDVELALLALEREAKYKAGEPSRQGLFVYQFEVLCRNRLGYREGFEAMKGDPFYDEEWRAYLEWVRKQVGMIDFADLIYVRSAQYVREMKRSRPDYEPSLKPLFSEKEGLIARANRNKDPLYLFAALQRHLGYPEVPRPKPRDDTKSLIAGLQSRVHDLETRLKLLENEQRGTLDLSEIGRPAILDEDED